MENTCEDCDKVFKPHWNPFICDACQEKDWRNNPHPLDIAEREHQEDQYPDSVYFGE